MPILLSLPAMMGMFGISIRIDHLRGNGDQHEGANANHDDDEEEDDDGDISDDDDYDEGIDFD